MTTAYLDTSSSSLIACTNCRERKTKCIPPANLQTTNSPCERCVRKGLRCQYVRSAARSSPYNPSATLPSSSPSRNTGTSALPNTGPPPTGHPRPRYADGQYPNLSLGSGAGQPQAQSYPVPTAYAGHAPNFQATQYSMAGGYYNSNTQAAGSAQLVPMPFFAGPDARYGYAAGQEEWNAHSNPPGNGPGPGYPGGYGY
ncbi:unnamed protein product [Mycena citricolor]|uniref:Zn(2)-C6 fungal-type domain-containing protein n=1 Tax=Mycena citricolor TaxID=2018698 RepID=A0AAD2JUD3_9AGAR|nr:unnamed protein product [Mycena citricolor]